MIIKVLKTYQVPNIYCTAALQNYDFPFLGMYMFATTQQNYELYFMTWC